MDSIKLIYTVKNITLVLNLKVILSKVVSELSSKLSHYQHFFYTLLQVPLEQ